MKIIIVAATPFSTSRGSHIRILHEAIALANGGHTIEILTYPLGNNPIESKKYNIHISRILNILPWYTKTSVGPSLGKIVFDIVLLFQLIIRIARTKSEIIYAHNHEAVVVSYVATRLFFLKKIKVIGDFHGSFVSEMMVYKNIRSNFLRKFFRAIEKVIHKMPDQAIASSRSLAEYILKDRTGECDVLYDAPSLPFLSIDRQEMRTKYSLSPQAFVVVYTGGFTRDKGIETLYSLIRGSREVNAVWIIAGGPKHKIQIPDDIAPHIHLVSPLTEETLRELLSLADCAVDPKERTSLQASGKMINYMEYGLLPFCFDDSISRDYLGDEIGNVASGKTVEEISQKIVSFAHNSGATLLIREKVQIRAKLFSWDSILEKI